MSNVKIYGAGSIGNHLANACRYFKYSVDIVDIDQAALDRTKNEIYPGRYGIWDSEINLYVSGTEPENKIYDLVFVGTPPDSHLSVALRAVEERPRAIVVEKPLCGLDFQGLEDLINKAEEYGVRLFMGYDHAVSESFEYLKQQILEKSLNVLSMDVSFQEHWGGIFEAHPWLDGPHDSYLGFYKRGGGALAEHSHGLHLWVVLADFLGEGSVKSVNAEIEYQFDGLVDFDKISLLNLRTESGFIGRCAQDVITKPTKKEIFLITSKGSLNLQFEKGGDVYINNIDDERLVFHKTRPDDFIKEVKHIVFALDSGEVSPLDIRYGIETMKVIHAAHESNTNKCSVNVRG